MARDLVIGLDLGTTAIKALAVDPRAGILGEARTGVALHQPRPGQVVIDAPDYADAAVATLAELVGRVDRARLAGVAISGAMHSLVPIDEHDLPLTPALTWADERGRDEALRLRGQTDTAALHRRTGCPLRWLYHGPRLRYFREQARSIDGRATRYATLKDVVVHRLTGRWAADLGLMSTTGLIDLTARGYDAEALRLADVSAERLPPLCEPTAVVGPVTHRASCLKNLPLIAGSSDGPLANLASVAGERRVAITVGTSAAVRVNCARPAVDDRELTWCYLVAEDRHVRGGAINNAGLLAQWVADRFYSELGPDERYPAMLADAGEAPAGAEGLVMLPYLTGERTPIWDPHARATLHGLALGHTRGHIARAALEAVALSLDELVALLDVRSLLRDGATVSGGIARARLWCQILADVLGAPLHIADVPDASALGAAIVGHKALGHIGTLDAMPPATPTRTITPRGEHAEAYAELRQRYRELQATLHGR